MGADDKQRLSGPAGRSRSGWDSAILDIDGSGHFILELWKFNEMYRLPSSDGKPREMDKSGRPRFSERWMDELRVTFTGTFTTKEAPGVKLEGFERKELNRDFVEDVGRCVDGVPTWWSDD